jgi:hypothetical protein
MEFGELKMVNDWQISNGSDWRYRLHPGSVRTEKIPIYTIMVQKAECWKDRSAELSNYRVTE